jgi:gas vesicle protein
VGALLGAELGLRTSGAVQLAVFAVVMIAAAVSMWAADDLSKRLQKNGDTLQNQIQKQREDLTELISRSVAQLQDVKTDRAALAELLSGVAAQLHNDSEAATAKVRGRK